LIIAEDLCKKISEKTGFAAENIRVREYAASQFKEIYLNSELIMRLRHKNLVWEHFEGERQRGFQIYYRVFDVINLEVGPLKEIFVESIAGYDEFALLLEEETGIQSDKILINKPISTYCDVGALFDCEWIEIKYLSDVIKEEPLAIKCDGEFIMYRSSYLD
jgi:hypothetical protein